MLVPWKALNETSRRMAVHLGSGEEETTIIGRGGEGGHRQGFHPLWAPPVDGDLLQIPGAGDIGNVRQLAGGGEELGPGEEGLVRMRDILLQTVFARAKFLTTAGQSSSVSKITRPRYLKEVTIYRGHP